MSKKSSPQAGPNRRSGARRIPRRAEGATGPLSVDRPGGGNRRFSRKKATPEVTVVEPTFASRMRAFLPVTVLPNLITITIAIVVTLIALIATSTTMAAFPATVAQFWLVVNLGPVVGRDQTVSVLPLVPALVLAWAVSRRVYRTVKDRVSIADLAVLSLCVLGIPILLTITAAAMLYDASSVFDVSPPPLGTAIARTGLIHGLALGWGMSRRLWRALCRRFRLPEWIVDASLDAVRALKYIGIGAAAVYAVALGIHHAELVRIYGEFGSAWGKVAVTLVSLLYLPNAVVATGAVTLGSEVALGQGGVSLFGVNLVPLPPVPLLAAAPQDVHAWAMVALAVPALGALLAIVRNVPTVKVAATGGLFAGIYALFLSFLTAGPLGVYEQVGPNVWLTAGLALAWVGGVAVIASLIALLMQRGLARAVVAEEIEEESVLLDEDLDEPLEEEETEEVENAEIPEEPEEAEAEPEEAEDFEESEAPEVQEPAESEDEAPKDVDKQEAGDGEGDDGDDIDEDPTLSRS